tara:strand:+ start:2262 stop:2537 length:276 start_codon:yes stop_codon:yes gene_type:complete
MIKQAKGLEHSRAKKIQGNSVREINDVINDIYREITKIKSVLSEQPNKRLPTPKGSIRVKQDSNSDEYTLEFKSDNGWVSNKANIYKLKGN